MVPAVDVITRVADHPSCFAAPAYAGPQRSSGNDAKSSPPTAFFNRRLSGASRDHSARAILAAASATDRPSAKSPMTRPQYRTTTPNHRRSPNEAAPERHPGMCRTPTGAVLISSEKAQHAQRLVGPAVCVLHGDVTVLYEQDRDELELDPSVGGVVGEPVTTNDTGLVGPLTE